jgi:predicted DNA-binding transcriptional regulator AlpA
MKTRRELFEESVALPKPATGRKVLSQTELPEEEVEIPKAPTGRKVLSRQELLRRIPYSYAHIYKLMRQNRFPRAREMHGRSVWYEDEIDAFLNNLPMRQYKGQIDA